MSSIPQHSTKARQRIPFAHGALHVCQRSRVASGAVLVSLCTLCSTVPALAEDISVLAERLAQTRGEVETLSEQLASETGELQDQLRSYARQKADLELAVEREKTRLQKLRGALAQKKRRIAEETDRNAAYRPAFERTAGALRRHIVASLPFRIKERLEALAKLNEQYTTGLLTPERALARLWSLHDDEFRMTQENGLFRQSIVLDGRERLADVIRLGMVMMYFRTSDGNVGNVIKTASGWSFVLIEDEQQAKRVHHLFDSFRKQIRAGYFELPNALPALSIPARHEP